MLVVVAHVGCPGAALDEAAERRGVDRLGHRAEDLDLGALELGVWDRYRGDERLGVGVLWVGEQLLGGGEFDDLAEVHHRDAVAHVARDGEVVGDVEVADVELDAELEHEFHDRDADRDVEHGGGLVGHHELWVDDEGTRDGDALPLASGKFVGVAVDVGGSRAQADALEEFGDRVLPFLVGRQALYGHRLGDGVEDGPAGVERFVGVLEDHLDPLAEGLLLGAVDVGDVDVLLAVAGVVAVQEDAPLGRLGESDEHAAGRRLAAA